MPTTLINLFWINIVLMLNDEFDAEGYTFVKNDIDIDDDGKMSNDYDEHGW